MFLDPLNIDNLQLLVKAKVADVVSLHDSLQVSLNSDEVKFVYSQATESCEIVWKSGAYFGTG